MYESYFHFSRRPFASVPHADAYLPTGPLERTRETIERCLDRAAGPAVIIGPAGTGKSLLCQVLARHFRGRYHVALLSSARLCTRRALLQNILFELKLPYRDMDEGELRLSLIDHIEPRSGAPEGLLLLVDEAHTLPLRLLEEVRLLTNVAYEGQSRVRAVLAGAMALEERLATPSLESFQQRIAARCYLQPLNREETIHYVREQIQRAGGNVGSLFAEPAVAAVHTATDGIPRLINQLCDHALMLAAIAGIRTIDQARIEEAWADLQQLPVPLHEPALAVNAKQPSTGNVVEFGQLADEPAAVAGTIGPASIVAAEARLEEISQQMESLQSDDQPAADAALGHDFSPVLAKGTEVELIFHSAHDPFGGFWEEEEVVIDRYASLEDAATRRAHRPRSAEARELEAAVAAALSSNEALGSVASNVFTATESTRPDARVEEDRPITVAAVTFDPASDPLLPEEAASTVAVSPATIALAGNEQDDRDLIVIEDDAPRRSNVSNRPRRPEYRKLFSTLRGK